jgi:tetratricopeptide (TPR) repeat protein
VGSAPSTRGRDDEVTVIELVDLARPHILLRDKEIQQWLDRLERRHDELTQLVEHRLTTDPGNAPELAAVLWRFWWQRGHMAEGRQFLERAAAIDHPDREQVLKGLGTIAFRQGDPEVAEQAFLDRLELVQQETDRRKLADAYADLARIALRRGDFPAVRSYAERGYEAAAGLGPDAIGAPLHLRAAAARMEGRLDEARALYLESRALSERLGNLANVAGEDHNLFHVALHSGDRAEAERRFRSSSQWIFAADDAYLRPYAMLDAGILALTDGDLERACHLVSAAQRIFEESGAIPDPDDRVELDHAVASLRDKLSDRFDDLWAAGRALNFEDARTLATRTT